MFHPTLDPKGMSDSELESKIKDVTLKINQASRMNNKNFYDQLLAINNTLQLENEHRKQQKQKESGNDDQFDDLINVK
mgnify:CR=1 FL=1|jgi:hypothetical protein|tara:strand:- start:1465 stop:1698 length:234 start_codon:yes stop_codon:yes gene_type:complete